MFLPQPSITVPVFASQNYSAPIHTTVVVTQGDRVLDYSLVAMDNTQEWMMDILKIDKMTGEIWLRSGWKELSSQNKHEAKENSKGTDNTR